MDDVNTEGAELARRLSGVNKAQFARAHSIPGGASMISQNISGHRPISLEAGIAYARALGCSLRDISPRLARQIEGALTLGAGQPTAAPSLDDAMRLLVEACRRLPASSRNSVSDLLGLIVKDPESNAADLIPILLRRLSGEESSKTGTYND